MLRTAYEKSIGCSSTFLTILSQRSIRICLLVLISLPLMSFFAGESQVVSLSFHEASLKTVFAAIKKQTGYSFAYSEKDLATAKPVSINTTNTRVQEALNTIFEDQPLTYTIIEKVVVVKQKTVEKKTASSQSSQQALPQIDIRGRVLNEREDPVAGITVEVKGTRNGTSTDGDGEFQLKNVEPNSVLVFTGVNIETAEKAINGQRTLDVRVKGKSGKLDEVQVIAYGRTSQRFNTGNVTTIKAEDIEKQPVSNPLYALQGRVPGLLVTQNTGIANGAFTARIQGQNSISNGNDPLIVVDGVPLSYELLGADFLSGPLGGGETVNNRTASAGNNPINFINPSDIESIDILKDADATAIYGSRAANGAILITTKKGRAGKTKVSLGLQQGWGKVTRKLELLNTQQYLQMRYEAIRNDGLTITSTTNNDLRLWDTTRYTDWQETLIGGTATYLTLNTSVSGGTTTIQYLIGGTYNKTTTVFPGDFANTSGSTHFNINASSANQKFKVSLTGNYMINNNAVPGVDLTRDALLLTPNAPALYNENGTLNWAPNAAGSSSWNNPMSKSAYRNFDNSAKALNSNAQISYSILPGLDVKSSFGYNNTQVNTFYAQSLLAVKPENISNASRQSAITYMNSGSWIIEPQISFRKSIMKVSLDVLAGSSIQKVNSEFQYISASGFTSDLLVRHFAAATALSSQYNRSIYRYAALFGRLNANWNKKYVLTLTARRDGSSRFGANNRFNNFWSVAGAWLFNEETALKHGAPFLSFGKIRGSYGVTGSDGIGDYQYQTNYATISDGIPYQNTTGLGLSNMSNPYVQWEEVYKLQGGIDLGFFNDRILFNITYARNRSSNQLLTYPLPNITGAGGVVQNLPATVQNTSLELMLVSSNIKRSSLTWTTSFNLTIPRNKVIRFPGIEETPYQAFNSGVIIGQPLGSRYHWNYLGVDPATGSYSAKANTEGPILIRQTQLQGRSLLSFQPRYYGGLINNFSYKGLSLDVLFQFVRQLGERSFFYWNGSSVPGVFTSSSGWGNQATSVLARWTKPSDVTPIGRFTTSASSQLITLTDGYYSNEASYIRLKNISLSWQVPANWLKPIHLQSGTLYIRGQNVATITKYTGLDPETQGIVLPPLQIWTIGFQVAL